jgi:hypothetical protein
MTSIQKLIWLQRAGLISENFDLVEEKKLSDEEIDKIVKRLRHEDDKEEKNELKHLIDEEDKEDSFDKLLEATTAPVKGKVSSDTKGKLHELLVGYHLLGRKHMEKHPDKNGDSPEEAHSKLKKKVHPEDYKKINARAKSAADDIKKKVEVNGHKIHNVHWTSQPNDLLRTTGIKATQKEDSSDIVVTTRKAK